MNLIDTHCHIHSLEFFSEAEAEAVLTSAVEAGVTQLICVATSLEDSKAAIAFSRKYPGTCWATIGIHPHEAKNLSEQQIEAQLTELAELAEDSKVVGVGECGYDFYYNDKEANVVKQTQLLRGQLAIAKKHNLPVSFHVREAFDDFWPVYEQYKVPGVLHSFTDRPVHAERALAAGLLIGINGIATFTTHTWQVEIFQSLPLEKIVLETDAPFLTPKPKRGNMNEPRNVIYITNFLAELRGEDANIIARHSRDNARRLFGLS